jgi:hypothetical protein
LQAQTLRAADSADAAAAQAASQTQVGSAERSQMTTYVILGVVLLGVAGLVVIAKS